MTARGEHYAYLMSCVLGMSMLLLRCILVVATSLLGTARACKARSRWPCSVIIIIFAITSMPACFGHDTGRTENGPRTDNSRPTLLSDLLTTHEHARYVCPHDAVIAAVARSPAPPSAGLHTPTASATRSRTHTGP